MRLVPTIMRNPRARGRALAALVLLLLPLAHACIGRMGRVRDPFGGGDRGASRGEGRISIEVQNLNFNDVTLYASRSGERLRIGQVTGKSDRTFGLDWNFALPLHFEADLVGGRGCRVREVPVDPGDRIWVRIPANIGITQCEVGKR